MSLINVKVYVKSEDLLKVMEILGAKTKKEVVERLIEIGMKSWNRDLHIVSIDRDVYNKIRDISIGFGRCSSVTHTATLFVNEGIKEVFKNGNSGLL